MTPGDPERDAAPPGGEDEILMTRVAQGNAVAFEMLVRRHMRRALAIAQGITGSGGDADEIAQEAFMRVWQHAGRWDAGRARFTTWLHRIVVNLSLDRRRRPALVPLEGAEELPEEGELPPEAIARRQERLAVAAAMTGIPDRQRAAVTLFYFEDFSGREAAGIMGISTGAFEQLLARARRAIKAALADKITRG